MKQHLIAAGMIATILLFSGCGDKAPVDTKVLELSSGKVAEAITIGNEMKSFTFNDQFEKPRTVDGTFKKVIFVFSRDMGDMLHEYLAAQSSEYLQAHQTEVVLDISRMPSLITKFVAMPGFQEYGYSMMLIFDEAEAKVFMNEKEKNRIMVVTLDNLMVKHVKFVATAADIKAAIE